MKKFRFLIALALVFTMLASVAMAADYELISDDIIYSGTGNIEVSLKSSAAGSGLGVTAELYYDSTIWSFVSSSDEENIVDTGEAVMIMPEGITVEDNGVLLTCTFAPVDDTVDVYSDAAAFKFVDASLFTTKGDLVSGWNKTVKVVKPTPIVKTYKVTFTNYSENDTTVDENTEITLPAAPAVGENEVFNGWNDGEKTYAAGAKYTVTKDVTFTADITTVVPQPTKAETKVESEKVRDLTYDTDKASHFFEGIYSVTPNDEKIATFGVNVKSKADASKTKTYTKDLTVEGGAKIVLRLALINDDVEILNDLTGEVFYTAE